MSATWDSKGITTTAVNDDEILFIDNATRLQERITFGNLPISPIGNHSEWIPIDQMWQTGTSGASDVNQRTIGTFPDSSDIRYRIFDFSADLFVEFSWTIPRVWDAGSITVEFFWNVDSGTGAGTVVWTAQAIGFKDNDSFAETAPTPATTTDTFQGNDILHISPPTNSFTPSSPTMNLEAGDLIQFRLGRDVSAGTFNQPVDLIGARINYITDTAAEP